MFNRLKTRMTYANVASTAALIIAVGGGGAAVAAVAAVPANSVGSAQIINGSVKSPDLKNDGVKGADVKESTLSQVPSAVHADSASGLTSGAINDPSVFGTNNLGVVRAYAWNSSPSADANLTSNGYTYNRSGGSVNVVHNGTGNYTITFSGLNLNGGNVVVSGYGGSPTWCTVGGWSSSSVGVTCFDAAGAAVDSYWTIAISE